MFSSLELPYQQLLQNIFLWTGLGLLLGGIMTLGAIKTFPSLGLLDFPERYNLKRAKLPYPGGLGIIFLLPFLLLIDLQFLPIVLGAGIIGVLSFWDDRNPIPASVRLLLHVGVAAMVWAFGISIDFITSPLAENNIFILPHPLISLGVTIFWILMLQNALNWFDGIKGLSVGVSAVGFLVLGLLGVVRPELFYDLQNGATTTASFFLAGICLTAFFWYWKGKILLGDSGAQVLGFLLATMSLVSGAKIATTLLVLGIPCIDFAVVIFRRVILEKKSPFKGDLKHIHHNLARLWGERQTTLVLIGLSALLGGVSLFTAGMTKLIILAGAGFCISGLVFWALRKTT